LAKYERKSATADWRKRKNVFRFAAETLKIMNEHFCKKKKTVSPLGERHNSSSKTGRFRSMESMGLLSVVILQAVITSHRVVAFY
jgi:hypothetical protein